jgi:uncharacterized protein YbaP (TraB family)
LKTFQLKIEVLTNQYVRIRSIMAYALFIFSTSAIAASERGILYVVESKDGRQIGCVVGTIHTHTATDEFLGKFVKHCGRRGQIVIMEVAPPVSREAALKEQNQIDALTNPAVPSKFRSDQLAIIQSNTTRLMAVGLDAQALGKLPIWQSSFSVALADMNQFLPSPRVNMEQQLFASLSKVGVSATLGLERAIDQIQPYARLSYEDQVYMLSRSIANLGTTRTKVFLAAIVDAWLIGDHEKVLSSLDRYSQSARERRLADQTIFVRNAPLVKALERSIAGEARPFTLMIGALHLGKSSGVLAYFSGAGYRLRRA